MSWRTTLISLLALPLSLLAGILVLRATGASISNGIMMVTHYRHLLAVEGRPLREAVIEGSLDRLAPILMTALTAALALIPIVLAAGEPGNEIQAPMAAVILSGLLSSTLLNLLVIPPLFARFASGAAPAAPP